MSAFTTLLIAVFAVSWASIFIRWSGDTPALVISFYRMFWSTLLFLFYQLGFKRTPLGLKKLSRRSKTLMIVAGGFLALHFYTWIASVQLTLISHSLILESTHPVFALILSPFLLKERGSWKSVLAVVLTLAGISVIAGQDFSFAGGKFRGDVLAVLSALFVTFYIFIARSQREKVNFIPYLIAVYACAAFVLLVLVVAAGYSLVDYPLKVHGVMLLLALIPTGIGHSLINLAARKIEAYKVNFAILGEPLLASIMAFIIFSEKPYGLFFIGAGFIVLGIIVALTENTLKKPV
jgi:drug/metabolite transporter (DMT)-like permease